MADTKPVTATVTEMGAKRGVFGSEGAPLAEGDTLKATPDIVAGLVSQGLVVKGKIVLDD